MKKSFADILSDIDEGMGRKARKKLPGWDGAEIPTSLSLEQCSSETAAGYKARLLTKYFPGGPDTVCDLTCGLGVDSLAFSRISRQVTSFERSPLLADAARRNFSRFGADNIEVRCEEVTSGTGIPACDVIYADPARRDGLGRKVFRLEDCSPDIRPMLPSLLGKARLVLLKLSPMADISLLVEESGGSLKEVHIVSLHSEVKELLCLLTPEHSEEYEINVVELDAPDERFTCRPSEEKSAEAEYSGIPGKGQYLHEPCPGLLKSGAFRLIGRRFGLQQADRATRLYLSESPIISPLLRTFAIDEVLPLGNDGLREARRICPKAGVSARNIPMSSEELRRRLKTGESSEHHIFGCSIAGKRLIVVCRRVSTPEQVTGPENMV